MYSQLSVGPLYGLNDPKTVYSVGQLMFCSVMLGFTTTFLRRKISISWPISFADEKKAWRSYLLTREKSVETPLEESPLSLWFLHDPYLVSFCFFSVQFYIHIQAGYLQYILPVGSQGTSSPTISGWTSVLSTLIEQSYKSYINSKY